MTHARTSPHEARHRSALWLAVALLGLPPGVHLQRPAAEPGMSAERLLDQVARRAFGYFWDTADPHTGLVNDRAPNGPGPLSTIASMAATGYGLAALPVGVERGWATRSDARQRAERTLRFILHRMPHVHGWLYHFVDKRTGAREWKSEVSTIDTTLLVMGALAAGQFFRGDVQRLADMLYDRLDWAWARTNGGSRPDKRTLTMGWKPERGFLRSEWEGYSEGRMIVLLGMGARRRPLPADCWTAWRRGEYTYAGIESIAGGPLFLHQMPEGYYDMRARRDRLGYDYWVESTNATLINRRFCIDRMDRRRTYGPDVWGLNACDGPKGYTAYGVPAPEDGTVSPTGPIASVVFTPELARQAALAMYRRHGDRIWGRYGFANAFNDDAGWIDPDVIGIDLGMALLALENHRSGLIWRLIASHPSTARAYRAAGFRRTRELEPRVLRAGTGTASPSRPPAPAEAAGSPPAAPGPPAPLAAARR